MDQRPTNLTKFQSNATDAAALRGDFNRWVEEVRGKLNPWLKNGLAQNTSTTAESDVLFRWQNEDSIAPSVGTWAQLAPLINAPTQTFSTTNGNHVVITQTDAGTGAFNARATTNVLPTADYHLRVVFRAVSNASQLFSRLAVGVRSKVVITSPVADGYTFGIGDDLTNAKIVNLRAFVAGISSRTYTESPWTLANGLGTFDPTKISNVFEVVCQGPEILCYINGAMCAAFVDKTFTEPGFCFAGTVPAAAASPAQPIADIDSFTVTAL